MDLRLRSAIKDAISEMPRASSVVQSIHLDDDGTGTIVYRNDGVWIDSSAPGFRDHTAVATDEECVRAYLLARLTEHYGYPASPATFELERVYRPVGRPIGKGGRIDAVIREPAPSPAELPRAFLFIECKAPSKFDADFRYIDGQLFRLSRQERTRPRYLVYYTVDYKEDRLTERSVIIDTETFPDYRDWDAAGQPISDVLPARYGTATKRRFGNVDTPTARYEPLDRAATAETLNRVRAEMHDVIWGGGGTNNNEVFVYITKLILAKIFDEKETPPGDRYEFQRLGDAIEPESPDELAVRLNQLYKSAEDAYLALPDPSGGPAFDLTRISADKLAFVVGQLEGLSITENRHEGDLLGEFFEHIVSQDFTQTKGQFFTPIKLVRFMLALANAVGNAELTLLHDKDHLGRPRLPYVIDPACGSGTFVIEYMKQVTTHLRRAGFADQLAERVKDAYAGWFVGRAGTGWAQQYLFGVENNYDLGLASKVNMVLHGDGSMNTWIANGLAPFERYWVDGRPTSLGATRVRDDAELAHPYAGPRNEQFDFVVSNPPFSLKLSADEKATLKTTFPLLGTRVSEAIFLERWYQLLAEGGTFCCVFPEAVLDTSTSEPIRNFLLKYFELQAIISLPYDTFRPFTSTKTCIVLASKRSRGEVERWELAEREVLEKDGDAKGRSLVEQILRKLEWTDEPIFMAEPEHVGYKRRKGLPDLDAPNDLYDTPVTGAERTPTVLRTWRDPDAPDDARFGFRTTLGNVVARDGIRLDPKYRWLWDFQAGVVLGPQSEAQPLSTILEQCDLQKTAKGDLARETLVIDLEYVESRQALLRSDTPRLDSVGSDKVSFRGSDIAVSKLEPYLGKVLFDPPQDALGSTEWVGFRSTSDLPLIVVAYLLMLPELCDAYRRLQAGKRHARLAPSDLLDLRTILPSKEEAVQLEHRLTSHRAEIMQLRASEQDIRAAMDAEFDARLLRRTAEAS